MSLCLLKNGAADRTHIDRIGQYKNRENIVTPAQSIPLLKKSHTNGRSRVGTYLAMAPHPVWLLTLAPLQQRNKHDKMGNILNWHPLAECVDPPHDLAPMLNVWICHWHTMHLICFIFLQKEWENKTEYTISQHSLTRPEIDSWRRC